MEGYDAKFDPGLEKRLECPICLLAQREPMQTPCGHRFCSACILRALRETGPRCPVDNTRVAVHQLFQDNFAKREVLSLHVRCHADEQGCKWQGELRSLESHSRQCELVTINCPNDCGHRCQRGSLLSHLPSCTNKPILCSQCSILLSRDKSTEHLQCCSKIKLPESVLGAIAKAKEILKWCGHLKIRVQGQSYSVDGYLTVKDDSEDRFIQSSGWSTAINLIPLTGQAAKIFLKTLEGPEVRPVTLNFSLLSNDTRAANFQKIIKKKFNAAVGLRLKTSSRRELLILYLYWSEQKKRMVACVAELKNYLVREMQSRLQQLKRISQHYERSSNSSNAGPSSRSVPPSNSNHPLRDRVRNSGNFSGPVRIINVPGAPPVSSDNQPPLPPPASQVLPSILSWQLSPSFPAYPWRVQAAGPTSVPFFTIPSTPPQFLPANSYPYTFAPMPAIAAPPFSINPFQQVPASLSIPSYAGVAVPQVTGLNGEVIMSSTTNPSHQLPDGMNNGARLPATAMIPNMTHPLQAIHEDRGFPMAVNAVPPPSSSANVRPSHPVNQVSVLVDPRINSSTVLQQADVTTPAAGLIQAAPLGDNLPGHMELTGRRLPAPLHSINLPDAWLMADTQQATALRPQDNVGMTPSPVQALLQSIPTTNTDPLQPADFLLHGWEQLPGPSIFSVPPAPRSPTASTPSSDSSSSIYSPSTPLVDSDSEFSPPTNLFLNSSGASPQTDNSTTTEGTGIDASSPDSQQGVMGSALQTLADAALLLSESSSASSPTLSEESSPRAGGEGTGSGGGGGSGSREVDSGSGSNPREERRPVVREVERHPDVFVRRGAHHPQPAQVPHPSRHRHAPSFPQPLQPTEDMPMFLPVIHTANEPHAQFQAVPVSVPATPSQAVMFPHPQQERAMNLAVAVVPDVPPLIHVAQGSHAIATAPPSEQYWANISAPIPVPAEFPGPHSTHPGPHTGHYPNSHTNHPSAHTSHHPGPHVPRRPQESRQHHQMQPIPRDRQQQQQQQPGSFWEDVMPTLDMRLQAMQGPQPNM